MDFKEEIKDLGVSNAMLSAAFGSEEMASVDAAWEAFVAADAAYSALEDEIISSSNLTGEALRAYLFNSPALDDLSDVRRAAKNNWWMAADILRRVYSTGNQAMAVYNGKEL